MQKHNFKKPSLVVAAALALIAGAAQAEQTMGVQPIGTTAIATARVNVRVTVPKMVLLRVGDVGNTQNDVDFKVGSTALGTTIGNSQPYSGTLATDVTTSVTANTTPATAGVLTTMAWTNATAGAKLTCGLGALAGATPFAAGATSAAGVPGTDSITVTASGTSVAHPGANLSGCGASSTSSANVTFAGGALTGTYTYAATFAATAIAAGTYGNVVTYTLTTQ